jgi:hypothetical protein
VVAIENLQQRPDDIKRCPILRKKSALLEEVARRLGAYLASE